MDPLIIAEGKPPATAQGLVGCIMNNVSGSSSDTQWFDYRPSFRQPIVRVEWDKGTMEVVVPAEVAEHLIRNGYARSMLDAEAKAYNAAIADDAAADAAPQPEPQPEAPKSEITRKSKKGDQS